jgi:DNA (cytosine-5)-methyltransferase 1
MIKLLDLCCKAGGASMGYYQGAKDLGMEIQIVGIDIEPQPNYPFNFIEADAVEYLERFHKNYTHIHASPPCQMYSNSTAKIRMNGKLYRDNLAEIRELMIQVKKPGVIENVPQAPMAKDLVLRGDMFGLKVLRKRHFELVNWFMMKPGLPTKKGQVKAGDYVSVFGNANLQTGCKRLKGFEDKTIMESWKHAMGCEWMKKDRELAEAIPPAYTRYISHNFFTL